MNRVSLALTTSLLCLSVSAAAQHGHGGMGMGGSMGSNMGHHSSMSHSHSSSTGTHGQRTMDQKLTTNTQLADKISKLTNMPAQQACQGFKNLGQCMAAAHVSQNLGIQFADLKDTMLGLNADGTASTTAKPMSLGKAIQTLDPQVDAKAQIKKAHQQSKQDESAESSTDSDSGL